MKDRPDFQKKIIDLPLKFFPEAAIHHFKLPTGNEGCWESIYERKNPHVFVASITPEGKLVLIRIFRFPIENWVFELPGGNIETGEDPLDVARKELREETGYDSNEAFEKLTTGWLLNGTTNASFVVYLARNCVKMQDPCLDPIERIQGVEAVEQRPEEIMKEIAENNSSYELVIGHTLISLLHRGVIKL